MSAQFQASAKIIKDVTEKLTELSARTKTSATSHQNSKPYRTCCKNPKQRGVLGEYYLEQILKNILPPGSFELQYKIGEGLIVDAVIKLDDKVLPVDSKFSLENYKSAYRCQRS